MSSSMSAALRSHYAGKTTTIARCWYIERTDGYVHSVTNIDQDVIYQGVTYAALPGVSPSSFERSADGAVPNSEIAGALGVDSLSEEEIEAGLWDTAFVTIFEVNYLDLSMGRLIIGTGTLGNLSSGRLSFTAELRGLSQALQQTTGEVYQPLCSADLGDSRCKVDVEALRVAGTLTSVADRRTFSDAANIAPDDWFGAGVFRVESGDFTGAEMEIYSYDGAGNFVLCLPLPFNPEVGMAYSVIPGCRKRHERGARAPMGISDCADKFNNLPNFRGFSPVHFPGNNRILGLGSKSSTNYIPS